MGCSVRWLIACVLAVFSSFASADGLLYGEVQLAAGGVQNADLDFYPVFGSISAGVFVLPGIGLEVFADTGLRADKSKAFKMDIEQAYGIAARFQSPPSRGIQGYIVLGMVNYTLNQTSQPTADVSGTSVTDDFTGVRLSVGLMRRLQRFSNTLVSFEYRHYNADEPLRVDALVFGLRVNAP